MKRNPLTLVIGLLLIVIFGLWLFVFQVRTTEVAVVTTFGSPTRPITEPNLYFKWPWPIQKVWTFDRRVQNFEDRLTEGLFLEQSIGRNVVVRTIGTPATTTPRCPNTEIRRTCAPR